MEEIIIEKLEDFLEQVMNPYIGAVAFYRGVKDAENHKLRSSIGRYENLLKNYSKNGSTNMSPEKLLLLYEDNLINEFKIRSLPFLSQTPESEMEWVCLAQHYGVNTRLLDWTKNALVALFFASTKTNESCDFGVYYTSGVNSSNMKHLLKKTLIELIQQKTVFFFSPPHRDVRYVNQAGVFSFHHEPFQDWCNGNTKLYRFPAYTRKYIYNQLFKLGITNSYIYPSLDSVSKDIQFEEFSGLEKFK